jgi:hypothetical protein
MSHEERADLEAELERGRAAISAGQGIAGDELLARTQVLMKLVVAPEAAAQVLVRKRSP